MVILQIAIAFCIVFIGSFFWRMDMDNQFYSNKKLIPAIVSAILGTWCVYSFPWDKLGGKIAIALRFVGKNTLTILTWHFLSFKLVSLFIIALYSLPIGRLAEFPVISEYAQQGWWIYIALLLSLQHVQ